MALTSCPTCGLPRAAADFAADTACPVCDRRPSEPAPVPATVAEPAVAVAPPPEPVAPHSPDPTLRNALLIGGTVVAGLVIVLGMLLWPDGSAPPAQDTVADVRPPTDPVATPPNGPELAPPPRPVEAVAAGNADVTPPNETGTAPASRPGARVVPANPFVQPALPVPPKPVALPGGVALLRFDRPDKDVHLPRIGDGNHVKLVGRVGDLIIDGVDGGATLDLTEITADKVMFHGRIEGGATVKVRKQGGSVSFGEGVGDATVEVDAPDGTVTFSSSGYKSKLRTRVDAGAKVAITARVVTLGAVVSGRGTEVRLTFTQPLAGKLPPTLTFTRIEDRARVLYKSPAGGGKPVKVDAGEVATGGECRPAAE